MCGLGTMVLNTQQSAYCYGNYHRLGTVVQAVHTGMKFPSCHRLSTMMVLAVQCFHCMVFWWCMHWNTHRNNVFQWCTGWNSNHWHVNDIGHHMENGHCPGGSTWNLPGNEGKMVECPGNQGKCLFPGLAAIRTWMMSSGDDRQQTDYTTGSTNHTRP